MSEEKQKQAETLQKLDRIQNVLADEFADLVGLKKTCAEYVKRKRYFKWWEKLIEQSDNTIVIDLLLDEIDGMYF